MALSGEVEDGFLGPITFLCSAALATSKQQGVGGITMDTILFISIVFWAPYALYGVIRLLSLEGHGATDLASTQTPA